MMKPRLRVTGLHRVPFDQVAFERDAQLPEGSADMMASWRMQVRENWDNAWIVILENEGPAEEIDFREIGHGAGPPKNRQAPWLEEILEDSPTHSVVAFFLHYVDRQAPIWYGDTALEWPAESAASAAILSKVHYSAPD